MRRYSILVLLFVFTSTIIYAQSSKSLAANKRLFEHEELLEVKLHANFDELLKDRSEDRDSRPAVLTYMDSNGEEVVMKDLKLKLRGNYRRQRSTCGFPPIRINFAKKKTKGTIFEGQDKLKLVTHCQTKQKNFEQYLLQEHTIYKMYNQLTEYSFLTRLIHITYIDSAGKQPPLEKYAFLIEDEELMAKRLGGKPLELPGIPHTEMNQEVLGLLGVFQYMVGNTDWSVPYRHNIKLIQIEGIHAPIPVPYDFDWSGLIAPPYALPNPMFEITSVKQRVYRGFCMEDLNKEKAINTFLNKKSEILSLISDHAQLDEKTKKRSLKYLGSFFKTFESPKKRENYIFALCR